MQGQLKKKNKRKYQKWYEYNNLILYRAESYESRPKCFNACVYLPFFFIFFFFFGTSQHLSIIWVLGKFSSPQLTVYHKKKFVLSCGCHSSGRSHSKTKCFDSPWALRVKENHNIVDKFFVLKKKDSKFFCVLSEVQKSQEFWLKIYKKVVSFTRTVLMVTTRHRGEKLRK